MIHDGSATECFELLPSGWYSATFRYLLRDSPRYASETNYNSIFFPTNQMEQLERAKLIFVQQSFLHYRI